MTIEEIAGVIEESSKEFAEDPDYFGPENIDGQFVFDWCYILWIICSYHGGKRSKTTIY